MVDELRKERLMERAHMFKLEEWLADPHRKPLILEGARQVGKTWLVKEFGRTHFAKTAYVNLMDNNRMRSLFEGSISPQRLLPALSIEAGVAIDPADTLIVLDEVQEAPRALTSLKYFCEDAPEYAVIATGSSMGVTIHQGTSFPVGKVNFQKLYPLTFSEFLRACGQGGLADLAASADAGLMSAFHDTLMEWLRYYFIVGGMPEAVAAFAGAYPSIDLARIRSIQSEVVNDYRSDFSRHEESMPRGLPVRLRQVWASLPSQLARENKKFLYSAVRSGARGRDFELAIEWLKDSSLVHKVTKVNPPQYPLAINERFDQFKLFAVDVGLLGAMLGVEAAAALDADALFGLAKGAIAEQYVCQQLAAMGRDAHYWQADNSSAELDFVIQERGAALPIEVKSGINLKSRSLKSAINRFGYNLALRFSACPPSSDGAILNAPLYAVESLPKITQEPSAWIGSPSPQKPQ